MSGFPGTVDLVESGLAYCRVHHGLTECDEVGLCCDMAGPSSMIASPRRPSAEDEGCDLVPLLYRIGDES